MIIVACAVLHNFSLILNRLAEEEEQEQTGMMKF